MKIWPESDVYILGGGPTLLQNDLSLIHNEKVIGVNNAGLLGSWVDVLWFGDMKWWQWHRHSLKDYHGFLLCCNPKMKKWPRIKTLSRGKPQGIDERSDFISWNRSSGASAINLAYHFGAKNIVLLGFDMKMATVNGVEKKNFHDDHKEKHHNPFARHLKCFPIIARDAERLGVRIINATLGSVIKDFPITTLEDAMTAIKENKPLEHENIPQTVGLEGRPLAETEVRKSTIMEKPYKVGIGVFIGNFNVFRSNIKIGDFTKIGHLCVFEGDIVIGEKCLIQPQCNITNGTIIEDKVFIGQGVLTGNDKRMVHLRREKVAFKREAPIFRYGCRVGMGSVILPGVEIGRESFIAAGSVVTRDTEPFGFYKGNPARKVSEIPEDERLP